MDELKLLLTIEIEGVKQAIAELRNDVNKLKEDFQDVGKGVGGGASPELDQLKKRIAEIRIETKDLDLARKEAIATKKLEQAELNKTTARYEELQKELSDLRLAYEGNIKATNQIQSAQSQVFFATERARNGFVSASRAIGDNTRASGAATQAVFEFSRGLSDAQQFAFGFQSGMIAIANNLAQVAEASTRVQQANGGLTASLRDIGRSLTGAGGLILAVNAAALALPFLGRLIDDIRGKTDNAASAFDGLNSAINKFSGAQVDFTGIQSQENQRDQLKRLLDLRKEYDSLTQTVERLESRQRTFGSLSKEQRRTLEETRKAAQQIKIQYGLIADVSIEDLQERIQGLNSSITANKAAIGFIAPEIATAYNRLSQLVERFAQNVDESGASVFSLEDQFSRINEEYQGFLKEFRENDGIVSANERKALDEYIKVLDKLQNEINALKNDVKEPIVPLKIDDSIQKQIELITAQIQLSILEEDSATVKALALQRLDLQQQLLDSLELSSTEYRKGQIDAEIEYINTLKRIETRAKVERRQRLVGQLTAEAALLDSGGIGSLAIQAIRENLSDRLSAIEEAQSRETAALKEGSEERLLLEKEFERRRKEAVQQSEQQIFSIRSEYLDSYQQITSNAFATFSDLTRLLVGDSEKNARKQFNIQKALGVSQSAIDTLLAVQRVWASPTPANPALKTALAISVGAAGAARTAAIAAQKFGQAGGVNVSAGVSASNFSEGFSFSDITPSTPPVSQEADNISDRLRNAAISANNITIENRVSNKEFYTLVKSGEGEILANSQSASRDRF